MEQLGTRRLRSGLLAALIAGLTLPSVVFGQSIDTNRPGFSSSPNVVEDGRWQLETGFNYARFDSDLRITSVPMAEVRVGVSDQVEVFVSSLSWSEADFGGRDTSGLLDFAVGTKISLSGTEDRDRMALLFQFSVPVGDDSFSSDRWDPSVAFVWALDSDLPFAGTARVSKFRGGYQLDNGLKLPFAWNDRHSAFVEWEANLPEHGGSTHWLNGGYQWLIDRRMQLDFSAGIGLNDRADGYRLGLGFSIVSR